MKLLLTAFVVFAFSGCGRPTVDEFLKGKRITCDIKVKVPSRQRDGETVDLTGVILENCRELR